jgi:carbon starvation protein CstA
VTSDDRQRVIGEEHLRLLALFGLLFILVLIFGILEIVSGRYISKRKRRLFSIVVSVPRILAVLYGTMLSIFTLLVLERKTVKELYREASGS